MFHKILYFTFVTLATIFLFASPGLYIPSSSFVFMSAGIPSIILVLSFYIIYSKFSRDVLSNQLKSMQEKDTYSWEVWVSDSLPEITTLFLTFVPYVLGFASISNALSVWIPKAEFLLSVSLITMALYIFLMITLLLVVIYSAITNRGRKKKDSLLN